MKDSPTGPLLGALLVTVLWAGNFTAGKYATDEFNPWFIASIRIVLAACFFPLFLRSDERRELRQWATWKMVLPLALTGILTNQIAFAAGIGKTTPGHSALCHALIPVFVLMVAAGYYRERFRPLPLIGVVIAIGGVFWLVAKETKLEFDTTILGDLITLLGAFAFSIYMVVGRRIIPKLGSYKAVAFGFVMAVPFTLPFLALGIVRQDWALVTWKGISALAYMLIAATFICYSVQMWAISRLGALRVAVFTNLQPILATLIALRFKRDELTTIFAGAAVVVIGGVALVQFTSAAPANPSAPRDSK